MEPFAARTGSNGGAGRPVSGCCDEWARASGSVCFSTCTHVAMIVNLQAYRCDSNARGEPDVLAPVNAQFTPPASGTNQLSISGTVGEYGANGSPKMSGRSVSPSSSRTHTPQHGPSPRPDPIANPLHSIEINVSRSSPLSSRDGLPSRPYVEGSTDNSVLGRRQGSSTLISTSHPGRSGISRSFMVAHILCLTSK